MSNLFTIDKINSFRRIKEVKAKEINKKILNTVKSLDEKKDLEPFIRSCIYDINDTPHGPAEIVDIYTHKLNVGGDEGLAAFIIKGKSFKTIKAKDVSHQIFRLKKISDLKFVIFAYTGNMLDQPKDEFVTVAKEINCKYSFFDNIDLSRLFVSEGILCPRDGKIIQGGKCICGYISSREELNILQKEAVKALKNSHDYKINSGLVVLPPGSGKTRIAAIDAKSFNFKKILYVAHTHEILDVAEDEFSHEFGIKNINRIINKKDFSKLKIINITTIQLLSKNIIFDKIKNIFDYIVIDEFHHAAAKTYKNLIINTTPKFLLGLTATPFRMDRQDIYKLCGDNTIVNYELRAGIDLGILSPYHYIGCFDDIDYTSIRHNGLSYNIKDLEKALIVKKRYKAVLNKWKEYLTNKQTISFCCSMKHAERCSDYFNRYGIKSAVYLSSTSREERAEIKKNFLSGEIKILFTVDVLNEGADFPFVEGLMFLRPTESKRIFLQQLGRGLRRYSGKREVIVLDFIGNFMNAYKITDYLESTSTETEREILMPYRSNRKIKEILNLPLNCKVSFEDKVIDVFCQQIIDKKRVTKYNIGKILLYNYYNLCKKFKRLAKPFEVDRYMILHSRYYKMVFGSWKEFIKIVTNDNEFMDSIS